MTDDNTIDYKFFEKEIASKYVMMRNSAMSARVKMNCLTQEVIRRLRNTKESLDWDEIKAPILTNFCKKMARSGYPESYRAEVIKSGVVGYERQLEASRSGQKPLFRPRGWQQEERRRRKIVSKQLGTDQLIVLDFTHQHQEESSTTRLTKCWKRKGNG